nr:MAG TPA: hypothetical protein [Caudoviricetes sp.]
MFSSVANALTIDLRDSISAVSIEVKSSSVVGAILSCFEAICPPREDNAPLRPLI